MLFRSGITREGEPERYDALVAQYFDMFAAYLCGTVGQEAKTRAIEKASAETSGVREKSSEKADATEMETEKTGAFDTDAAQQTDAERDALRKADYVAAARRYLAECGLGDAEIEELEAFLTRESHGM